MHPDRKRWDEKYASKPPGSPPTAPPWLVECLDLIESFLGGPARALDIACGDGRAALELARRGWQVDAFDVSTEGLRRARRFAERTGVRLNLFQADALRYPLPQARYQLVTVFNFLDRRHLPEEIHAALATPGFLVYETYTLDAVRTPGFQISNTDYLLHPNELLHLYAGPFRVIRFRDQGLEGRPAQSLLAFKGDAGSNSG